MKRVRCAIYTRKSSDEGLEQAFNSLHAQRDACAAYVMSQASEGWTLLPQVYDDGGLSGGTLERPALQRLLADVAAGQIDIIVVYKVDRLTRSLLDFAKLVEAFDRAGTSFVSVTQSFNTTTSMGRLTLNMLLSFAQFEREVTAERIRDKIAASKAKGMWMGGTPPLGYKPDGRSLAIVNEHAALVRHLFERYLSLGNVPDLLDELRRQRVVSPERRTSGGATIGGKSFGRGQLYFLLKNPIYAGLIRHKDKLYAGSHPPLIERETWDRVQTQLEGNTQGGRRAPRRPTASMLAGLIVDENGTPLRATHACKGKVRYRYYAGLPSSDEHGPRPIRLPAPEIEKAVVDLVAREFDDPLQLAADAQLTMSAANLGGMMAAGASVAASLRAKDHEQLRTLLRQVRVLPDKLEIALNTSVIGELLGTPGAADAADVVVSALLRLTRTGHTMRLVLPNGAGASATPPNLALLRLIIRARQWWARMADGVSDAASIAREEGVTRSYVSRTLRAAFLAPSIVDAIVAGEQPLKLEAGLLRAAGAIPISWAKQQHTVSAARPDPR